MPCVRSKVVDGRANARRGIAPVITIRRRTVLRCSLCLAEVTHSLILALTHRLDGAMDRRLPVSSESREGRVFASGDGLFSAQRVCEFCCSSLKERGTSEKRDTEQQKSFVEEGYSKVLSLATAKRPRGQG